MRGKGQTDMLAEDWCRITPAYAGKSRWSDDTACKVPGSPPPMRGKGIQIDGIEEVSGITPAYAGKSCVSIYHACNS